MATAKPNERESFCSGNTRRVDGSNAKELDGHAVVGRGDVPLARAAAAAAGVCATGGASAGPATGRSADDASTDARSCSRADCATRAHPRADGTVTNTGTRAPDRTQARADTVARRLAHPHARCRADSDTHAAAIADITHRAHNRAINRSRC